MKKTTLNKPVIAILLLFLSFTFTTATACKNDDDNTPVDPIALLPPATQTGENTFGCLLDGEAFLPGVEVRPTTARYEFVNGGYYLTIGAIRDNENFNLISIGCNTQNLEISEGETYQLEEKADGNAYGKYIYATQFSYTNQEFTGELTITKLDLDKNIISGIFWYDIKDHNDNVHQIREGRFDLKFTQ